MKFNNTARIGLTIFAFCAITGSIYAIHAALTLAQDDESSVDNLASGAAKELADQLTATWGFLKTGLSWMMGDTNCTAFQLRSDTPATAMPSAAALHCDEVLSNIKSPNFFTKPHSCGEAPVNIAAALTNQTATWIKPTWETFCHPEPGSIPDKLHSAQINQKSSHDLFVVTIAFGPFIIASAVAAFLYCIISSVTSNNRQQKTSESRISLMSASDHPKPPQVGPEQTEPGIELLEKISLASAPQSRR